MSSSQVSLPPTSRPYDPVADDASARADAVSLRRSKRRLLDEFNASWDRGAPLAPEDVLARWPADPAKDRDAVSVLFEDYQRRAGRGDEPSVSEYEARFPGRKDSIAAQFRQHEFLRSVGVSTSSPVGMALPCTGDVIFGFRLRHELGSGAFARVYLAEQVDLAGRPVVVKVSGAEGDEPRTLAQLQHTHVVPIYSCHEDQAAGLRAVCMPYFGGASLSRVLGAMWPVEKHPTSGRRFVEALRVVRGPSLGDLQRGTTSGDERRAADELDPSAPVERMAGWDYFRLTAWLVARLAEGLQHAHQRGVLHRDIKPSNILVCADGQPMLLDFNLSEQVNGLQAQASAALGGTVSYMAPEHLRAMASRDPVLVRQVDRRSDVYSLGMVLFEMLVGQKPFDQSASYAPLPALIEAMAVERGSTMPSPRATRADVPWGLESIVRKCLDPDPARRYQEASELAEDLQAYVEDRPLRHAPELSRQEVARKWARRHPRLMSTALVAAVASVVLCALGSVTLAVWSSFVAAAGELEAAVGREQGQRFDENAVLASCFVHATSDVKQAELLRQGLELCRTNLAVYHVLDRDDWQELPAWRKLEPAERAARADAVREVLLLYAWALMSTSGDQRSALEEALALVDRAEKVSDVPPTPALWLDRAGYLVKLGRDAEAAAAKGRAESLPPATARDYYLLATSLMRNGGAAQAKAVAALDEALRLNPRHYWSLLQRAACHLERGDHLRAVSDFSEAVRVWPDAPLAYFSRGYAFMRAGRNAVAEADYGRALERDPQFVHAHLNRGLVRLELGQFAGALADFDAAVALGHDDAPLHVGRGKALEALGKHADADQAFARALDKLPTLDPALRRRQLWVYGFAVADRLPAKARDAFDAVLADEPNHPQALYGRAMLAARADQTDAALAYFQRALAADPNFLDARRYQAVLHARRGQLEQATADVNWCLQREQLAGEVSGATFYAAACVAAQALDSADPRLADDISAQVLSFLQRAFARGYGRDRAAADPDLAPARALPAFQQMLSRDAP